MLFVLLWLQACATAPTVLTEVDIHDVEVAVRTPLPDDCFEDHSVAANASMSAEGKLSFKRYVTWADALVTIVKRYQAQSLRCRNLNAEPGPTAPIEEP